LIRLFYAVQSVAHKCAARPPHQGFGVGRRRSSGEVWLGGDHHYTLSAAQPSHSDRPGGSGCVLIAFPPAVGGCTATRDYCRRERLAIKLRGPLSVPGYARYQHARQSGVLICTVTLQLRTQALAFALLPQTFLIKPLPHGPPDAGHSTSALRAPVHPTRWAHGSEMS